MPSLTTSIKKRFKDKKVVVMGLGLHGGGAGVAKFFCRAGAEVLITDLKTKKQLEGSLRKLKGLAIKYVFGRHRIKDFAKADLIIKNPDVPSNSFYLKVARKNNVPINTDIGIFFELSKATVIGVTGTKGKSMAATLIYKLLKTKYPDTVLAGNIGVSPLEVIFRINKKAKVVLELSSFELEDLKKSPRIAVVTNVFPDHLNRYRTFARYVEAKKNIFKYQKKKDILLLNFDNLLARKFSSLSFSRLYFYSMKAPPKRKKIGEFACFLKGDKIFFGRQKKPIYNIRALKLYGEHNISNVLAALSVAKLLRVSSKKAREVLDEFNGLPGRQEFIKEHRGVKYFNDTTATMPEATRLALKVLKERFPRSRIILIAGGQDKNLSYKDLAIGIKKEVSCLILLPGSASEKLKKELKGSVRILPVGSMAEAVKRGSRIARRGDIVLLSPAATSFNLFKNEFDRGEQFNKEVRKL